MAITSKTFDLYPHHRCPIYRVQLINPSQEKRWSKTWECNQVNILMEHFHSKEDVFNSITEQVVIDYIKENSSTEFSCLLIDNKEQILELLLKSGFFLEKSITESPDAR